MIGYSLWRKKNLYSLLGTSIVANLITQSLLWIVLHLFFQEYLVALWAAELFIWLIESALLYFPRANDLSLKESLLLSLSMNLASVSLGWRLPV